jgi:hypothetical protein
VVLLLLRLLLSRLLILFLLLLSLLLLLLSLLLLLLSLLLLLLPFLQMLLILLSFEIGILHEQRMFALNRRHQHIFSTLHPVNECIALGFWKAVLQRCLQFAYNIFGVLDLLVDNVVEKLRTLS